MTESDKKLREEWALECVGHTKEDVVSEIEAGGAAWRIFKNNGRLVFVTRDYKPDRFNLGLVDGIVTEVHFG